MTEPGPDLPVTSEPGELVVDLQYLDLVTHALAGNGGLGVTCQEFDRIDELDLVLLKLTDANGRDADLDAVLSELRWRFAAEYGGWMPAMGKNRNVSGHVGGFPQPESMLTGGDPKPPPANRLPQWDWSSQVGKGIRVGLLDTKLYPHEQLRGRYLDRDKDDPNQAEDAELRPQPGVPIPFRAGHSTFVAGLILAQAPAAEIHVRWVLDETTGKATVWQTVKKMAAFANDGVDILNLSFGCRTSDGQPPLVISRAIERLSREMIIVAAAGNHGRKVGMASGATHRSSTWPAALADVVATGAEVPSDFHPDQGPDGFFSPELPWVTVTAPGLDAVSAYLEGEVELLNKQRRQFDGYAVWSGTSFAAATVSGVIAANAQPGKVRQAMEDVLGGKVQTVVKKYVHTP